MGNSDSKDTKKGKKKDKDDGCIGNRRVRTILLSLLLCGFGILALSYVFAMQKYAKELEEAQQNVPEDMRLDWITASLNGWNCVAAGFFITIVGAICAIVLFFIPNCEDNLGRVAGFILILGGFMYVVGWILVVAAQKDAHMIEVPVVGGTVWDAYPDNVKAFFNARWAALIGEALLFGLTAALLGIDALLHWFDDEAKRLSSNLGVIMAVAALATNAYFMQICKEEDPPPIIPSLCVTPDGVEAIATGYAILFFTCLAYIVLYICTCCTCDCKDACLVRFAIAVALCIGGVLTSIGYYVYVGGHEDANADDFHGKFVAYWLGYTLLIGGLPVVWALDIAFDDVKNR